MNAEAKIPDHPAAIPHIAAEHMGTTLMQFILQEMKLLPMPWQQMSEDRQRGVIERANFAVKRLVAGCVNTIATQNNTCVTATIESINLKDKVKVTAIVHRDNAHEAMTQLYESGAESTCQIVLTSAEMYLGGMDMVQPEPDQPEFELGLPKPDEELLWCVTFPTISGNVWLVPAQSPKLAFQYAELARKKLIESGSDYRRDLAKTVYALPWQGGVGEHLQSIENGDWDTFVTWIAGLDDAVDPDPQEHAASVHALSYTPEDHDTPSDPELVDAEHADVVDAEFTPVEDHEFDPETDHYFTIEVTIKNGKFTANEVGKPKPNVVSEINALDAAQEFAKRHGPYQSWNAYTDVTTDIERDLGTRVVYQASLLPF